MVFYHVMRHKLDVARSEQASRDGIPQTFLCCFIAFAALFTIHIFSLYFSLYNPLLYTNLNKCIIVIRKVFWLH